MATRIHAAPAAVGGALGLTRALHLIRLRMNADESVLLMLDATGTVLEPVASAGLDRTSRASVRVPVGRGFAGRVAAERSPVILEGVDETNVLNPVLRAHGIRTLLGVPVVDDDGELVGVVHVGSKGTRAFGDRDVEEMVGLARELYVTIRERTTDAEHTAALVLQRSLVPTLPTPIPGLDIAARYVPAEGDLGGDWYDVFALPGDRVGFVMGDVVGHGLGAAVVMGRLRSALRSYALVHDSPSAVLGLLDRKISHFEPGTLATVIYGVAEPPFDRITFSTAGHWPPITVDSTGQPQHSLAPQGLILGVDPKSERRDFTVPLPRGATMCLFTDGLIDLHRQDDGPNPYELLEEAMAGVAHVQPAEQACSRIVATVVGNTPNDDDIALMVIRRAPETLPPSTA